MPNLNHSETEGMYKLENGLFDWLFAQHKDVNAVIEIEGNKQVIMIYPNPANDYLIIETLQKSEIEISNIEGQIIRNIYNNDKKTKIDLGNFSKGVYIIKTMTDKGLVIKKFIKE
jgi:hypothetical protein